MKRLSIKTRVTLLCTLLAALIAAAALTWLIAGEARTAKRYYKETLSAAARLAQDQIFYDENGSLCIDRNLDELPSVHVAVFSIDGDLLYGKIRVDKDFAEGEPETVGGWIVYDELLSPEGGDPLWLRCAMSVSAQNSLRGGQHSLALMIFSAMVLLGGLGGDLIARRAFRPVAQIVRTAESIAGGEDLKKRIGFTGAKDELAAMADAFDAMFGRLDEAFDRERRFTSDASHELRTPVAGILAQSDFALSDAATDADRREALSEIHRRAGDMSGLIQRLLTLSRMDAKRLTPEREPVDLGMIAEVAAATFEERGTHITVRGGAIVRADQTMIAQAVMNLVENAVKYGGAPIEIEVCEGRLSVSDRGPGIPAEAIPHLFERFWQGDSSRHGEGSGLGLSLVERIMALHGGRVEVESAPDEGAKFTLIFPKEV